MARGSPWSHLGERIRAYLEHRPDQHILVQPEGNVDLQRIVSVLDRLTEAGGANISLLRG